MEEKGLAPPPFPFPHPSPSLSVRLPSLFPIPTLLLPFFFNFDTSFSDSEVLMDDTSRRLEIPQSSIKQSYRASVKDLAAKHLIILIVLMQNSC